MLDFLAWWSHKNQINEYTSQILIAKDKLVWQIFFNWFEDCWVDTEFQRDYKWLEIKTYLVYTA